MGKQGSNSKFKYFHSFYTILDPSVDIKRQYKTNPNILESHEDEDTQHHMTGGSAHQKSQGDAQFMGKRNQH